MSEENKIGKYDIVVVDVSKSDQETWGKHKDNRGVVIGLYINENSEEIAQIAWPIDGLTLHWNVKNLVRVKDNSSLIPIVDNHHE